METENSQNEEHSQEMSFMLVELQRFPASPVNYAFCFPKANEATNTPITIPKKITVPTRPTNAG